MKFQLLLSGRIPSGNKSVNPDFAKRIRLQIHDQLQSLWQSLPLSEYSKWKDYDEYSDVSWEGCCVFPILDVRHIALINSRNFAAARLDIHFYDPEGGLNLKSEVVDVDNRLKVLFDALQIPQNNRHIPDGIERLHTLLENDRFIWDVSVQRHRLLRKIEDSDFFTQIIVEFIPQRVVIGNLSLFGVEAH
ncbi:hypothetical protein E2A64_08035 [Pseudohoeflea suaedae]|uniref:Uncharacterized protein n=1 Tax=Pseudohoeflea suaedae TaxID=877384 RepID=A0A4R5PPK7_9HYPH|nr:hypothetical protein [Pseudohoeflea suaedae]TDH39022.1 hypothetical protein E2A64_08035 [Pseudohoeflea suaedae]